MLLAHLLHCELAARQLGASTLQDDVLERVQQLTPIAEEAGLSLAQLAERDPAKTVSPPTRDFG